MRQLFSYILMGLQDGQDILLVSGGLWLKDFQNLNKRETKRDLNSGQGPT